MKKLIILFVFFILCISLSSCFTQRNIIKPLTYPIPQNEKLDLSDVKLCIENGIIDSHWTINSEMPKEIIATDSWKRHAITVEITYDRKDFTIKYKRSKNLNYRKSFWSSAYSIHRAGNNKIKRIYKELIEDIKNYPEIKKELALLNSWIWKPLTELSGSWGPPDKIFNNGNDGRIITYIYKTQHLPGYSKGNISSSSFGGATSNSYGNSFGSSSTYGTISTTNYAPIKKVWYIDFYVNKANLVSKWKMRVVHI